MAARGACAAARADAARRRAHARTADDPEVQTRVAAFLQALQQLGWTDGRNVRIDTRWAAANADEFVDTRRNWPRSRRTSSWPLGSPALAPLLQATRTVPIVFVSVVDPVGAGFVDSLARPGGNATGFISFEYGIERKMAGAAQRDRARRDASGSPSGSRHNRRDRPIRRDPVRGAVARRGGNPGQRARCRARSSAPSRHSRAAPNGGLIVTAEPRRRSFIAI